MAHHRAHTHKVCLGPPIVPVITRLAPLSLLNNTWRPYRTLSPWFPLQPIQFFSYEESRGKKKKFFSVCVVKIPRDHLSVPSPGILWLSLWVGNFFFFFSFYFLREGLVSFVADIEGEKGKKIYGNLSRKKKFVQSLGVVVMEKANYSTLPRSLSGMYSRAVASETTLAKDDGSLHRTYSKVILRRVTTNPSDRANRQRRSSLYVSLKDSKAPLSTYSDQSDMVFFAERKKDTSLELLVHGLHLTKTDLKKMEKLTKINIHLHGMDLVEPSHP